MWILRPPLCLAFFAPLIPLVSGCQALHSYRPVSVLACDAETKKPIPGAEVRISYPLTQSSSAPWESVGLTGDDGVVHLRAAPYGEAGILLDATAPAYLSQQKNLPVEAVEAIKPPGLFHPAAPRPADFVVEMYAAPGPELELVVPTSYRGVVKVTVRVRDDLTNPPGQRLFSYAVPPSGDVEVTGPPLLRRVYSPDYRAKFADGTPLSRRPEEGEVGFWCLKTEGASEYFVVGTRAEYDELRRSGEKENSGESHPTGRGGGRGGRRGGGRGGNAIPPDSGSGGMTQ